MFAALQRAAPFLKSQLGRMLRLRFVPGLQFERDPSFDQAQRIDEILKQPEVARDLGPAEHEEDDDGTRSEEHTSELQSLMRISYAVFCLKKKTNTKNTNIYTLANISTL